MAGVLAIVVGVSILVMFPSGTVSGYPQPVPLQSDGQIEKKIDGFPIVLDGNVIAYIRRGISGFSAEERAYTISRRLNRVAQDDSISVKDLAIRQNPDDNSLYIGIGQDVLLTITKTDASARRLSLEVLAEQSLQKIKNAVLQYRQDRQPRQLARNTIYALFACFAFLLGSFTLITLSGKLFPAIEQFISSRVPGIRVHNTQIIPPSAVGSFSLQILTLFRLALLLIAFLFTSAFVLRLYPWTRAVGEKVMSYFYQSIEITLSALGTYFPNIFVVAIIVFIAYYTLRVIKPFFLAIERGTLVIPGFYDDWAKPTYNLFLVLVIALAAILAFPYLPGFNSPAFQGVSVFLGLLLSLGSTSAITNVIGGIILIYTRAFRIGDHIRVGDVIGDIIEKNFLAIRICTPANQIITIPNSALLSNNVTNYNISKRDLRRSLILQTTITLGYDVPWRKIHTTLVNAALATHHILKVPTPFVLQTSLDNNYISYQLNAYTDNPNMMVIIYSELHQSIQDHCNENGIEILSPSYTSLRDGNASTMPATYLPSDYVAPPFHVEASGPSGQG